MRRSFPLLLGVAGAVVALDQWSKQQASAHLAYREPVRIVGDLLRLTYARNSGIAFSLFAGRHFPLWIFSLVAAIAVVVMFSRQARLGAGRQWALALIMGGAIGNLIDRVTSGQVVDFILLSWGPHDFPVFNVADMAVTCGVSLFALTWPHDEAALTTAVPPAAGAPPAGAVDAGSSGSSAGSMSASDEVASHDQDGGPDRSGAGSGAAGGPLAREGPDRPLA